MTARCDGEEWALDFGQELQIIDAALKTASIDTQRFGAAAGGVQRRRSANGK
jgi:hypothetical protein